MLRAFGVYAGRINRTKGRPLTDYMFWNQETYKDGNRVPRVTYKCKSHHPDKPGHTCKMITDHGPDHKCICGEKW